MSEAPYEKVELARVAGGLDLWPAIEAAQYALIIDQDDPANEGEHEAMTAFAEAFGRWVEEWEERPREAQSSILDELGRQLEALGTRGLSLYGTTVERQVPTESGQKVRMPIALLRISKDERPTQAILLPIEVDAG